MDFLSEKVIYHQILRSEKDVYYKLAINCFREKDYIIQSITCNARRGLLKALIDTPTQMCQFHHFEKVYQKQSLAYCNWLDHYHYSTLTIQPSGASTSPN